MWITVFIGLFSIKSKRTQNLVWSGRRNWMETSFQQFLLHSLCLTYDKVNPSEERKSNVDQCDDYCGTFNVFIVKSLTCS